MSVHSPLSLTDDSNFLSFLTTTVVCVHTSICKISAQSEITSYTNDLEIQSGFEHTPSDSAGSSVLFLFTLSTTGTPFSAPGSPPVAIL